MAERDRLISVIGGRAVHYVDKKKPSDIIPFNGNLPLLESYEMAAYREAVENTTWLEELSEKFQRVTVIGNNMAIMENSFNEFLKDKDITPEIFVKLSNSEKSDNLITWMNKEGVSIDSLKIK